MEHQDRSEAWQEAQQRWLAAKSPNESASEAFYRRLRAVIDMHGEELKDDRQDTA